MNSNSSGLNKYRIGLATLGIFTLVLLGLVITQAASTKTDNETYKSATKAAEKLSTYVTDHDTIPASLAKAGISDAPSSVSYEKLSSQKYKFCVTYKADSSGFDPTSVESSLMSSAMSSGSFDNSSNKDTAYLYIPSTHHKGENCQTIKPYIYSSSNYNFFDNYGTDKQSTTKSQTLPCETYSSSMSDAEYEAYVQCMEKQYDANASSSSYNSTLN